MAKHEVTEFGTGTIIDPTQMGSGVVLFFHPENQEIKKKYGKALDDQIGDTVFFHLHQGRHLGLNGAGEVVVINTRPSRLPVPKEDRIVYIRFNTELGPKAIFWAMADDLPPDYEIGSDDGEDLQQTPDTPEEVTYRVMMRTYKEKPDGTRQLLYETRLWEGEDPFQVPSNVWDPQSDSTYYAGDTIFEKVWQCKGDWTDCSDPRLID